MPDFTREAPRQKQPFDAKKWTLIFWGAVGIIVGVLIVWTIGVFFLTFRAYRSPEDGLQMLYPKTWEVRKHPGKDVLVAFASPKETALDSFIENYNFSFYDMSKKGEDMSASEYADRVVKDISTVFRDMKLVERVSFPIAGQKGYKLVFRATTKLELLIILYVFTIQDMAYNILYIGSFHRYAKDNPMMDVVALSTKVKY